MDASLLDTDTLSEVFKRHDAVVLGHTAAYLTKFGRLSFSAITRYEVLRGLKQRQATTKIRDFEVICQNSQIFAITDSILDLAAELWAFGRLNGFYADDADLLIGATAIESGLVVVTGNTNHFSWMPTLRIADWRLP